MPEQHHKSFGDHIASRTFVIMLAILPYLLVAACGALAVAAVVKTSTGVVNAKFNAVRNALRLR